MATITANVGAAGNWNSDSSWIGGVKPTAADDAVIPLATTSITIDAGSVCRSADFNTFTGTITMGATGTLTIGDGTAGAGNIALRIPAGGTFVATAGSIINLISTSATLQTIAVNSAYSLRTLDINCASNGNYALTAALGQSTCILTLTKGTLHVDGAADNSGLTHAIDSFISSNSNTRVLLLGNSTISITGGTSWSIATSTGMTLTAGTSTINANGGSLTFQSGGLTYATVDFRGPTNCTLVGTAIFATLKRTGTNNKTSDFTITNNITVTSSLVFAGDSATNRVFVKGATLGVTVAIASVGVTHTWSNVDIRDVGLTEAYNASAITGGSGSCGGTSAITFTTAVPKYAVAAGNWSDTATWSLSDGGASGAAVPLPQDDVTINANSGVGTITCDMPRIGKNIDFTGYTGTFVHTLNIVTYGNWTWGSGVTVSTSSFFNTFEGRGSHTIMSNGKSFNSFLDIQAFGGTYTLQDALTNIVQIHISRGTFNANNFNVSATFYSVTTTTTRVITMGSGTWSASRGSSTVWDATTTTGLTLNAGTSTFSITDTGASGKTFIGGGLTYYNLRIAGGGAGAITITGANTFNRITVIGGTKSIVLPGSTTTTILSGNDLANDGNLITFTASAGSATVSKAAGILSWHDVSLTNIPSTGGARFYAGATPPSVNGGGNTGWIFTNPPSGSGGSSSVSNISNLSMLRLMGGTINR